jgi:hypothetical protein
VKLANWFAVCAKDRQSETAATDLRATLRKRSRAGVCRDNRWSQPVGPRLQIEEPQSGASGYSELRIHRKPLTIDGLVGVPMDFPGRSDHCASYTTLPPTMVVCTFALRMASGFSLKMLSLTITMSASLPGVIEPFSCS